MSASTRIDSTSAPSVPRPVRSPAPPGVLPLELPPGPGPFTPGDAARLGIGRSALERMVHDGRVVRLVRGVYLDASRPCPPAVRAEALALAVGADRVVCGLTAAWVLGVDQAVLTWAGRARLGVIPIEARGRRLRPLGPDEMIRVGPILATAPVQTAVDVARRLELDRSIPVIDALLACRALAHADLLAGARRATGPGSVNVRAAAARSEARAAGAAESVLRVRWTDARLPTPIPGFRYGGVRLGLALPWHRFAVVLAGSLLERHQVALQARGWRIVVLRGPQVLGAPARALEAHLEREFHQHLLEEVG